MKIKIVLSVLLVLSVAVFYFSKPNAKENSVINLVSSASTSDTVFRIGLSNIGVQTDFEFLAPLKCNLWHIYMGIDTINGKSCPVGWTNIGAPGDTLFAHYSAYITDVQSILTRNKDSGYLSNSMRPKIEMLTFAQRSNYQCEYVQENVDNTEWWYAFDSSDYSASTDTNEGGGVIVKHLTLNLDSGYIAKQLRANREQVDNRDLLFNDANYSWYIKPRMRIDSAFANNPANVNKRVCRVDVINYDGDTIRKVDMTVLQFLNDTNFYNGSYKEDGFRFTGDTNRLLIDSGIVLNPHQKGDTAVCKFDIQVYWYGECEIWLDYVRVDNDWADRLFKDYYVNPIYNSEWIKWEADQIASYGTTYNFYADELEYNMMPAIAYLNEKIHTYKPNLSVNSLIGVTYYTPELRTLNGSRSFILPWSMQLVKSNIQKWGMNEVMTDIYPLYGTVKSMDWFKIPQYIPQTLGSQYNTATGVLGYPAPIAEYERNFDSVINRLYIPHLVYAKDIGISLNKPIHIITTNQLFYSGKDSLYSQREPTNEELGLLNYLAVSYSAKAILYFKTINEICYL